MNKKILFFVFFFLCFNYAALSSANEISKEQCDSLFQDQKVVNNIEDYLNLHADANHKVRDNNLY